ncbi:MAG TPA: hypothetical protein VGF08_07505 [Terriglobales bacterium]
MKRFSCILLALALLAGCELVVGQTRGFPKPPEPADPEARAAKPAPTQMHPQVDRVQLQREARELSDLAHTLPADVESVNRGLLPKDVIEKLKRIEKLSKHLRGALSQ